MAVTPVQPSSQSVTIIEALQARYDEVADAHEVLQTTGFAMAKDTDGRIRKSHLRDAEGFLEEEWEDLERCILNQQPVTWSDACILAAHVESVGSDFSAFTPAYQKRYQPALARGLESLLVFIAEKSDLEADKSRFVNSVLGAARRRVLMRTGRPLEDAWFSQAD